MTLKDDKRAMHPSLATPPDHPPMATSDPDESDAKWLAAQIEAYTQIWQRYDRCADLLKQTLQLAVAKLCPGAIVEARPKSITSFAEKALRKRVQYADPLVRFTDLCGARVIAHTRAEVAAV